MPSSWNTITELFLGSTGLFVFFIFSFLILVKHYKTFFLFILATRPVLDLIFNSFITINIAGFKISELIGALIFTSFIFIAILTKSYKEIYRIKFLIFFVVYVVFATILSGYVFSYDLTMISYGDIPKIATVPIVIAILLHNFNSMESIYKELLFIRYGYFLLVLFICLLYIVNPSILWELTLGRLRFNGGFQATGKFANYLCIMLPIFLISLFAMEKSKLTNIFLLLSIFIFLYLTKYRTSQIAVIVLFLSLCVLLKKYRYLSVLSIISIFFIINSPIFQDGIDQIITVLSILFKKGFFAIPPDLFTNRMMRWQIILKDYGISYFALKIFGQGPGMSKVIFHDAVGVLGEAHNGFIQLLIEYGLIGVILYSTFVINLISGYKKARTKVHNNLKLKYFNVIFLSTIVMHLTLCFAANVAIGYFTYNIYFAYIIAFFIRINEIFSLDQKERFIYTKKIIKW